MQLLNWDCLELMKSIPDGSIDAIITDPPYWTTACKWDTVIPFEPMWEQLKRIIKPNGAIVLFGSEPFSSALRMSNIKQYKYDWIWKKSRALWHLVAKYRPMSNNEIISVFWKWKVNYYPIKEKRENPRIDRRKKWMQFWTCQHLWSKNILEEDKISVYDFRNPTTVLEIKNEHNWWKNRHPTQKPVSLIEYLIKTYTNEWETVLDFTMWSGTTGVACKNTNRNFIWIELDKWYFDIATERINNL